VLLTTQQRQQLKADWQAQHELRKIKRPTAFTAYEAKHKNAVAWIYTPLDGQQVVLQKDNLYPATTVSVQLLTQGDSI